MQINSKSTTIHMWLYYDIILQKASRSRKQLADFQSSCVLTWRQETNRHLRRSPVPYITLYSVAWGKLICWLNYGLLLNYEDWLWFIVQDYQCIISSFSARQTLICATLLGYHWTLVLMNWFNLLFVQSAIGHCRVNICVEFLSTVLQQHPWCVMNLNIVSHLHASSHLDVKLMMT